VRIETDRLVLRLWEQGDAELLAPIMSAPGVAEMLGGPLTVAETQGRIDAYMRNWHAHGFTRFAVELRETGELVGRVGVMHEEHWVADRSRAEIGWAIAPAHWGRGLATEASLAVLDDAFGRARLRRLIGYTYPHNAASRRVFEKLGFAYEGSLIWEEAEHVWYSLDAPA
jgi:RimJ/RimL family protein N-acetyltransferase